MDNRVVTALDLVRKQRKLVGTTKVGSPAHRQASDVLALIEESHFLLSEMRRVSSARVEPTALPTPENETPEQTSVRRIRLPVGLVVAFAAALVAAAVFLEVADPTPMNIQASELGIMPTQP